MNRPSIEVVAESPPTSESLLMSPMDSRWLAERLARVERDGRRWRWIGLVLTVVLGLLVASGARRPAEPRVLEAERILVRDEAGKVRITLAAWPGKMPVLTFLDEANRVRMTLSVRDDGSPAISLNDRNGSVRLMATSQPDDSASLSVFDRDGKIRIAVNSNLSGAPRLSFHDATGKPVEELPKP
jgi:hypothetical protein